MLILMSSTDQLPGACRAMQVFCCLELTSESDFASRVLVTYELGSTVILIIYDHTKIFFYKYKHHRDDRLPMIRIHHIAHIPGYVNVEYVS